MAALEAAIQQVSVNEPMNLLRPRDAGALGGRVKPGHGDGLVIQPGQAWVIIAIEKPNARQDREQWCFSGWSDSLPL